MYYYNWDWLSDMSWRLPFYTTDRVVALAAADAGAFTSLSAYRFLGIGSVDRTVGLLGVADAGWHLTYFMSIQDMVKKLKGFAHVHDFAAEQKSEAWVSRCLREGRDILDRFGLVRAEMPAEIAAVLARDGVVLTSPQEW